MFHILSEILAKISDYLSNTRFHVTILLDASFHEGTDHSLGATVQKPLSAHRNGPDESVARRDEPMLHEYGFLIPIYYLQGHIPGRYRRMIKQAKLLLTILRHICFIMGKRNFNSTFHLHRDKSDSGNTFSIRCVT